MVRVAAASTGLGFGPAAYTETEKLNPVVHSSPASVRWKMLTECHLPWFWLFPLCGLYVKSHRESLPGRRSGDKKWQSWQSQQHHAVYETLYFLPRSCPNSTCLNFVQPSGCKWHMPLGSQRQVELCKLEASLVSISLIHIARVRSIKVTQPQSINPSINSSMLRWGKKKDFGF